MVWEKRENKGEIKNCWMVKSAAVLYVYALKLIVYSLPTNNDNDEPAGLAVINHSSWSSIKSAIKSATEAVVAAISVL